MILFDNLPHVLEAARGGARVLDVGGWYRPLNLATDVIDILPYETRRTHEPLDPDNAERFTAQSWVVTDICDGRWPYQDDEFDFVFCSHTLEDVRDPVHVAREIARVGKAGYIETPSAMREIFCKRRQPWRALLRGGAPDIGFPHHRWFMEHDGAHGVVFSAKTVRLTQVRAFYLTRREAGGKLTQAESGCGLWWQGSFTARENVHLDYDQYHRDLKQRALATIRKRNTGSAG